MRYIHVYTILSLLALVGTALPSFGQEPAETATEDTDAAASTAKKAKVSDAFVLGQIDVVASVWGQTSGRSISQSVVTSDDVWTFDRNTLDDALTIVPGVAVANSGGSRNEQLVFVRGFDRWQVPLSIDGVRVYLPADNRMDFGRFLTPDLAEVQIQKGYVSVLNGPGGMGGAINLVTRKPTEPFEAELRTGVDFGNTGDVAAFTTYGSIGTLQDKFYLQGSAAIRDSDGWFLSRDFDPTPSEDGGRRDFSDVQDWRINLKAGYTPNDTDEYAITFTKQEGEKGAPYSVLEPVRREPPYPSLPSGQAYQRDWTWPYWNIQNLAFLSHTAIGDSSYVESKLYYNTFDNLLSAYDDSRFLTQTSNRSFDSYYADYAYGGSLEAGTDLIPMDTLKASVTYRLDSHTEWQQSQPDVSSFVEPHQQKLEETISAAVENTFHATDRLDWVVGVSYEHNELKKAKDYSSTTSSIFEYPLGSGEAVNWQSALIYKLGEAGDVHASVSSRTRFPTLFERYSTRFGDAEPNPDLEPEHATNYEIGWSDTLYQTLNIDTAVFYSDLENVIQSVSIGNDKVQNQNVGDGRYYGFEISAEWKAAANLVLGGNYTLLERELTDPTRPGLKPIGTPEHQTFLYAKWNPFAHFTVTPSLEYASSRWSTDRLENNFYKTAGFTLVNLDMEYQVNDRLTASVGARNIFDVDYDLAYGFPEPGRTIYVNSRLKF